jgi:high-affinity Fe2+/Pb2+ permease
MAASFAEEGMVMGAMWLATNYPMVFGVALVIVVVLMVALLISMFTFLKAIVQRVSGFFYGTRQLI